MTAGARRSGRSEPRSPGSGRRIDALFIGGLAAWTTWVIAATRLSGHSLVDAGGYLAVSGVLGGSVLVGRAFGAGVDLVDRRPTWLRVAIPAMLCALALGVLAWPLYANAQAAVGVQLVALCGLMSVSHARRARARISSSVTVLAITVLPGILGMVLATRAQAAQIVVSVLLAAVLVALVRPGALPRPVSALLGISGIGGALMAVLLLTTADAWPAWLSASQGLSRTRHLLWRDAAELWRNYPLLGGGPGEFLLSSPTAQSQAHLYAVHSSVLQVGSELGTPGALLFVALVVLGVLLAARADRARALIGVAGWSALAVHSIIDHLYEFPVVVVLAGLVIGCASALPALPRSPASPDIRPPTARGPRRTTSHPAP